MCIYCLPKKDLTVVRVNSQTDGNPIIKNTVLLLLKGKYSVSSTMTDNKVFVVTDPKNDAQIFFFSINLSPEVQEGRNT